MLSATTEPLHDEPTREFTQVEQRNFERVAWLSEATKELIARSFRVNLLALDAMVQSKRGGSALRGFDEVSSQMRSWSRDLHRELEVLRRLSQEAVSRASRCSKEAHMLRLLGIAARTSGHSAAVRAFELLSAEQLVREADLARTWRRIADVLGDLDLLGMMATVLSRSAMIEAASGTEQQRAQLNDVSQEFYRHSEAVLKVLKGLIKAMKRS